MLTTKVAQYYSNISFFMANLHLGLFILFLKLVALFVHLVMLPYSLISPTSPNAKELNLQQNSPNLNRECVKAVVGDSSTGNMR